MEKVYINKKLCKNVHPDSLKLVEIGVNVISDYNEPNDDPVITFNGLKTRMDGSTYFKKYTSLPLLRTLNSVPVGDIVNDNRLLDEIGWVAVGESESRGTQEFYFVIDTNEQLLEICSHYSLDYPIPNDLNFNDFKTSNFSSNYNVVDKMWGSVTFDGDTPTRLKAYLFEEYVPS